ncbi:MAG TPA: 30S ribosomal protein S12 methylthiotransferase RimO [Acidimicrobiales bacterium]|nr:30S ribosomal protein S12 methylthiotransferase RimO [Acidimicrobiales bacterium]
MAERYWLETLGCPKNRVDSDKLAGTLLDGGYRAAGSPEEADLVVVNTCAFIEAARQESIDVILELSEARRDGARLVVTGCLAERHGTELARLMPEVDLVAGFGVPVTLGKKRRATTDEGTLIDGSRDGEVVPAFDLLNLPRPPASAPWAYVKVAEGCDRRCGFCAIPQFRGRQRSRPASSIIEEVEALGDGLREVVLVAQDLASWGLDRSTSEGSRRSSGDARPIVELVGELGRRVERVRLLYLYPSSLDEALVEAILSTGVAYFDLSLQHVSRPLLKSMQRWGDGERFLERIESIRAAAPDAALRSSFILGYPGETEEDHDMLLEFLEEAQLDWAGFFTFSEESGTHAAGLPGKVPSELALERLRECSEIQDAVTAANRSALVTDEVHVLVDEAGVGRTHREAPEIDGVVHVPHDLPVGEIVRLEVTGAAGPDLWAERVGSGLVEVAV